MPVPNVFKRPNEFMKFNLFKFHNIFKGLIGIDNLEFLNATIDVKNKKLITPNAEIQIHYQKISKKLNSYEVQPRTEQIIRVRTSIKEGDVIIPSVKSNNCEIPECLTKSSNYNALVTIVNKDDKVAVVDFTQPLTAELYEGKLYTPEEFHNLNCYSKKDNIQDIPKIRTEHMNPEERYHIQKLVKEYSDIFHNEDKPLTFSNKVKHEIKTHDEMPIYTKSYRYPFVHKQEVQTQIQKMLSQKIIQPSNSPWSSPIWIVPKKLDASGKQKWRVVVDYRKLNEKTINDKYPLPNITDILDKLGRCQYFSTLDLASGFHQIEMNPRDSEKTAFNVENGHFEYLRMPFGLKNAPATFQRVMDNILKGIQNELCLVYMDDIIIFSVSLQEQIQNLRKVFDRLRNANFKIQIDKSEFFRKEVNFLGHVITPSGIRHNPDKIKAIKQYPVPKTQKQLKGFLGLLGYYRKFINNFATITKPLTQCLKKNANITLSEEYMNCIEKCKNLLTNEPILQYPDFTQTFNLTTDASNVAIGAVLSQGTIGKDLPVAYASRTLNESEKNYSTIEKELLAIVYATKYFRPYLYGRKFKIITDHKPLQWLFSLKEPNSKLVRWRLRLEEYDYDIIYKKGKLNANADALSRIEINWTEEKETDNAKDIFEYMDAFYKELNQPKKVSESVIVNYDDNSVESDEEKIIQDISNSKPESFRSQTDHSNQFEEPENVIPIIDSLLNKGQNQLEFILVNHSAQKPKLTKPFPNKFRLTIEIGKDKFETEIINFIQEYIVPQVTYYIHFKPPEMYYQFSEIIRKTFRWPSFKFLCVRNKLIDVPENEVSEVIQRYHESKTNHRGINETESRIRQIYYWPGMRNSVQTYINSCDICQRTKYERVPIKTGIGITPTPTKPFEIIHLDTLKIQKEIYLTIIDSFSKFAQIYKLPSLNSLDVVSKLIQFFSCYGVPKRIVTDNGTEFKNTNLKNLLALHKIEIHFTTPENPKSNGMIERLHSTLLEHIRLLKEQFQDSIENQTLYAILAYNNTIHSATKQRPIDIVTGHLNLEDPFDIDCNISLMSNYVQNHKDKIKLLYQKINEKLQNQKEQVAKKYNENINQPILHENETFYPKELQRITKVQNKFRGKELKHI